MRCRACSKAHPQNPQRQFATRLKKTYGISVEEYNAMVLRQKNLCMGCRRVMDPPYVDHNHDTGVVRGLLCMTCNAALGLLHEDKATFARLRAYLDYDRSKNYLYAIGSLANPRIPIIASELRKQGIEVIDDWHAAGPEADRCWQQYELNKGHTFAEALRGRAAQNVFLFDKALIDLADAGVLIMPAGRSGHLEMGYMAGQGKRTYILHEGEPERFDVMPQFCTAVCTSVDDLIKELQNGTD